MTRSMDADSAKKHKDLQLHQDPQSDVQTDLQQMAADLRKALLNAVWRQWQTLGAGAASHSISRSAAQSAETVDAPDVHALIDPEALVLVSLTLIQDERRLGDLLYGWAARNSDLLSVQRMKNLQADYPEPSGDLLAGRLSWFATVAIDRGKDLRWRSLAREFRSSVPAAPASRGRPDRAATVGERSENPYDVHVRQDRHGKALAPRARLTEDATLLLRLRLGFGIGVKADLLGYLLALREEWAAVRAIAVATSYTPAAVRRAADDLAAARLIESRAGQPARYRVAYGAWAALLGLDRPAPGWVNWHERFVFSTAVFQWAQATRDLPLSPYAFGAHGRDLIERYGPGFEEDVETAWGSHAPIQDWGTFVRGFIGSVIEWMEGMG